MTAASGRGRSQRHRALRFASSDCRDDDMLNTIVIDAQAISCHFIDRRERAAMRRPGTALKAMAGCNSLSARPGQVSPQKGCRHVRVVQCRVLGLLYPVIPCSGSAAPNGRGQPENGMRIPTRQKSVHGRRAGRGEPHAARPTAPAAACRHRRGPTIILAPCARNEAGAQAEKSRRRGGQATGHRLASITPGFRRVNSEDPQTRRLIETGGNDRPTSPTVRPGLACQRSTPPFATGQSPAHIAMTTFEPTGGQDEREADRRQQERNSSRRPTPCQPAYRCQKAARIFVQSVVSTPAAAHARGMRATVKCR